MASTTRERFKLDRLDRIDLNLDSEAFHLDSIERRVTARLDDFEGRLPPPADTVFRLPRAIVGTTYAIAKQATESVADATGAVVRQVRSSGKRVMTTVKGQSETVQSDVARMTEATKTGVKDIAARVETATEEVTEEIKHIGDEAVDYHNWTKDELYDRAQQLNIAGRSGMSKEELITAITK
jgi:hypothetical protein